MSKCYSTSLGSIYKDSATNIGGVLSRVREYYFSIPVSTITNAINNSGIPASAEFSHIELEVSVEIENSALGTFNLTSGFGTSTDNFILEFGSSTIAKSAMKGSITRYYSIGDYMNGRVFPMTFNTSYGNYFNMRISSDALGKRSYWINSVILNVSYCINNYNITTSINIEGAGSVTGGGWYERLSNVTLTATANPGYAFVKWSDGNTQNPRTVTVTGDAAYIAEFQKLPPEFNSVSMIYMDKQISSSNKVICNESFIISVDVT